jgi:hypothetical protein
LLVDRAIEVSQAAFDLHVSFVDASRSASSACEAVPPLFEFRNIALNPAHYRRMGQKTPAFGHHFQEIRKLSLNLRYHRTQRMMISQSKWRPLKRSSMLSIRVRLLQRSVHAKYAALFPVSPEPRLSATSNRTSVMALADRQCLSCRDMRDGLGDARS